MILVVRGEQANNLLTDVRQPKVAVDLAAARENRQDRRRCCILLLEYNTRRTVGGDDLAHDADAHHAPQCLSIHQ